jgi:hypothetical protein
MARTSPLGALGRGVVAGLAGTAAMTAYQTIVAVRRGSSVEETVAPEPPDTWEDAPAPAQVGYRFLHGVFRRDASPQHSAAFTNAVHWSYGAAWGALYGLVQGTVHAPALRNGAVLGTTAFGSAYVMLPAMNLYDPPWNYSPKTLATDWSYHLVYGLGVAGAYRLLDR